MRSLTADVIDLLMNQTQFTRSWYALFLKKNNSKNEQKNLAEFHENFTIDFHKIFQRKMNPLCFYLL